MEKIPMFNRTYIFLSGPFFQAIAMLSWSLEGMASTFAAGHGDFWRNASGLSSSGYFELQYSYQFVGKIRSMATWIWVFPKIGVPQNGWYIMENHIKMDDLGVPLFLETPICLRWFFTNCAHSGITIESPPFFTTTIWGAYFFNEQKSKATGTGSAWDDARYGFRGCKHTDLQCCSQLLENRPAKWLHIFFSFW